MNSQLDKNSDQDKGQIYTNPIILRQRMQRPKTSGARSSMRNSHTENCTLKQYSTNNIAWMGPTDAKPGCSSTSVKSLSREKLREKIKKLASLSTDYKSISALAKNKTHLQSKLACKTKLIKINPFGDNRVVQHPFSGGKRDVNVMNNTSLFRNTTKLKGTSGESVLINDDTQPPNTANKLAQTLLTEKESNTQAVQILDCSFSSNFPFFSRETSKEDLQNQVQKDQELTSRAKTPAIESHQSQRINRINSMSPKGILKKPNTAQVGMNKRVHYPRKLNTSKDSSFHMNNPQIENVSQSSYFNSVRTDRNNDPNSEANKLKRKVFKNAKQRQKQRKMDHCTLKHILQYKNAFKSYNTVLFRNRVLDVNKQKKSIVKEGLTKIADYDNQEIYVPPGGTNNMTIMNSHTRKSFKSIDVTSSVNKLVKKSEINPEVAALYKKYGVFSMITKTRPHSGYKDKIKIKENRIAAGAGFRGAYLVNKQKLKVNLKRPESKSTDHFGSRK
ncbi:unnamed protein product [Moneuplotes crassus]|uniref:Uncharacterized protein n=1 Tax=Euplotes crassus TaxID=5936 RepID=A0AAD1X959_EUPCR|nr:unnamed protein product [Moneuplotes crassus]